MVHEVSAILSFLQTQFTRGIPSPSGIGIGIGSVSISVRLDLFEIQSVPDPFPSITMYSNEIQSDAATVAAARCGLPLSVVMVKAVTRISVTRNPFFQNIFCPIHIIRRRILKNKTRLVESFGLTDQCYNSANNAQVIFTAIFLQVDTFMLVRIKFECKYLFFIIQLAGRIFCTRRSESHPAMFRCIP